MFELCGCKTSGSFALCSLGINRGWFLIYLSLLTLTTVNLRYIGHTSELCHSGPILHTHTHRHTLLHTRQSVCTRGRKAGQKSRPQGEDEEAVLSPFRKCWLYRLNFNNISYVLFIEKYWMYVCLSFYHSYLFYLKKIVEMGL